MTDQGSCGCRSGPAWKAARPGSPGARGRWSARRRRPARRAPAACGRGLGAVGAAWRSPCTAGCRSAAARRSRSTWVSTRIARLDRAPPVGDRAGRRAEVPASGSSALIRHSITWPRRRDVLLDETQRWPAAVRICSITRSRPERCSLTQCSTCSRVFISMNRRPAAVEAILEQHLDRAGADVADRAGRGDRGGQGAWRTSSGGPATGSPRSASGGCAGPCSRARRRGRRAP
jgi:hypothetical protein